MSKPDDTITRKERSRQWTPNMKLMLLKEVVSAVLGLTVVGFTVYLAAQTFLFVGNQTKMSDGRDLLTLMLGVSGVVLGYYFGRVPADAAAAQAQQQSQEATVKMAQMGGQQQAMAQKLEVMALDTMAGHPADADMADMAQHLRQMADQLRHTAS
jgi:hypothetical protein